MVGVIEMDVPWSEKEKTLKVLAQEFRNYNARV
jgi:vacuolar-type H+-ATPase subunit D/Vma8